MDDVAGARPYSALRPTRLDQLGGIAASVPVPTSGGGVRRFLAFSGPGYLVATGYMDPGNWATALAGGSRFGSALLFVAVISSLIAILLQSLSARLAVATGEDLASQCRAALPRPVSFALWLCAEGAIVATDLAEVIGTAIGLQLVFGMPLKLGVLITVLDVFLILALQRLGFRKLEAVVVAFLVIIAAAFTIELVLARPDWADVARGLAPTSAVLTDPDMLYIAAGIIGATVMPHNLFLHSGIVQTRAIGPSLAQKREALRFVKLDSAVALTFALAINASILILAAAAFHAHGYTQVAELENAYQLIAPLLGTQLAATLFGVALLACGLNSTITATLAGQIVMEGFIRIRLPPWQRRLVTRLIAILPAVGVIWLSSEAATGRLLVLSQVVLSLALPFAVVPLVWLTASRGRMGALVAPRITTGAAAAIAALLCGLNAKLVWDAVAG